MLLAMEMWQRDVSHLIILTAACIACKNNAMSSFQVSKGISDLLLRQRNHRLIQCFALVMFYRANKRLCAFYQLCNTPSEGFLSGNGGGSEGLCTVSYQIYCSCSGILLADRF